MLHTLGQNWRSVSFSDEQSCQDSGRRAQQTFLRAKTLGFRAQTPDDSSVSLADMQDDIRAGRKQDEN